jgi:ATP-dependent RNA helicase RhlB
MKFTEFNFNEKLAKGIEGAGFTECTPVQAETFKFLFEGRDIYAQSQTGTGKTAAFIISAFHLMAENEDFKGKKTLVIAPTRELAVQIEKEAEILGAEMGFSIGSFYGGVGYNSQEQKLKDGCDLLIGTPGRLIDFGKSGKIDYSQFGICIIDEADRLFDMGFLPDLRLILKKMPPREERRTMLYSATLSSKVGNLAWEHLNNPGEIVIEPDSVTVDAITQELYHVGTDEKMRLLLGLFKKEKPETAIVFTNTKHTAYEVAKRLEHNGYDAQCLMGDLPQKKRLKIVDDAKEGKVRFLVATDVAARGLHIDDLTLVVNYDIPGDCENYVHRIGRTARAGKSGKAISLACEKYVYGLPAVEKYIDLKIPVAWATDDLFVDDKSEGMRFHLRDSNNRASSNRRPRDDNRNRSGNRDRSRDNRNSRPDRSKDNRSRENNGSQPKDNKKSYPRNKRPLEQSEKRVQSMVLEASGSADFMKSTKPAEKSKKRYSTEKKKDNRSPRKPSTDNRPRNTRNTKNSKNTKDTSYVKENGKGVTSKNSIDDRLAYYRSKYGDDFKVDD